MTDWLKLMYLIPIAMIRGFLEPLYDVATCIYRANQFQRFYLREIAAGAWPVVPQLRILGASVSASGVLRMYLKDGRTANFDWGTGEGYFSGHEFEGY